MKYTGNRRQTGNRNHHKIDHKRYIGIAVRCTLVMFACITAVFLCLHTGRVLEMLAAFFSVFSPVILGALLTYILSPMISFFERRIYHGLDKKKKYRLKRVLSVVSAFILIIVFLLLLIFLVIPGVLKGYADLMGRANYYLEKLNNWLMAFSLSEDHPLSKFVNAVINSIIALLASIYQSVSAGTPDVTMLASSIIGILSDVILGIILSIYFLFSKEKILAQFKKCTRAFLSRRKFGTLGRSLRVTNEKFGGFLKGQVADALIIGILSYIILPILNIPFYPLVSVLVGIASFIPVFGILIGTLIGAIIIVLTSPGGMIVFVAFMICLYFFNKKLIRPHVMHNSVDLSSVFMLTAIILTTGLVGFWGLVLGVPIFAVLYALLYSMLNKHLRKQGLPTEPYEYYVTDAGKELYLERENRKLRRRLRLRNHTEEIDVFAVYDDEAEEETLAVLKQQSELVSAEQSPAENTEKSDLGEQ